MAPTVTTTVPPSPGRPVRPFAGGHVRSASVPCHSHPLVTHVDDQLLALRSWTSNPGQNPLSLAHVRALLCVLDELLHLPLAAAASTDRLLHGFLVLAVLLAIRQHAAELQATVRRRDQAKIASAARAQRQVDKELAQLAAAVAREASRCARASVASCSDHARGHRAPGRQNSSRGHQRHRRSGGFRVHGGGIPCRRRQRRSDCH
ncbi:hypothetical protein ABZP36_011575 [Zizania latifolia]